MLKKLPSEHPPLKGCVNLKSIKEVMALDFDEWDSDSNDLMIVIDHVASFIDEDWQFVRSMNEILEPRSRNKPPSSSYLPVRLQSWFNESNLKGLWFYDVRVMSTSSDLSSQHGNHRRTYRICFQYMVDATLFKLSWDGE
jgi:hypothetical protein